MFHQIKLSESNTVSSLTLYYCGWEDCAPCHSFGPATRPHYLFHFILSGKGTYCVEKESYDLSAGQGFLICPGISTVYTADQDDPWTYCWFGFDGYEAKSILTDCGLSKRSPIYTAQFPNLIQKEMMALIEIFEKTNSDKYLILSHLYRVFSHMSSQASNTQKVSDNIYFEKAIDFIHNGYSYDIKIQDIAKHIGIDRTYLYKIFMKEAGRSPQQYLISVRLHTACDLLFETDLTITEISYSCGFKDTPSFYKHFKNQYHMTPIQYRQTKRAPKEDTKFQLEY